MTCSISLTTKGLNDYHLVLKQVFAFINSARKEGPQKYYQDEMEYMKKIGFDFKPRINVLATSKNNAALL